MFWQRYVDSLFCNTYLTIFAPTFLQIKLWKAYSRSTQKNDILKGVSRLLWASSVQIYWAYLKCAFHGFTLNVAVAKIGGKVFTDMEQEGYT